MSMMWALCHAGFRRYAAYRQATVAACITNTVFGCLRTFVLLATTVGAGGVAAGYTGEQLSTYVWMGQGMLGVVMLWGHNDLADRVRSGEVAADLLRPVNPIWVYLAGDLGRAAHAACTRMVVPITVGALLFPFYRPDRWWTYPLVAVSVVLAVLVCFALRYLVNLTSFWLLDIRGVSMAWVVVSGVGSGLYFPLTFFPDEITTLLYLATPFPSIMQFPADVAVEYGGAGAQLSRIGLQVMWCVICMAAAVFVQSRATRKLVIQGGLPDNPRSVRQARVCADPQPGAIPHQLRDRSGEPDDLYGPGVHDRLRHVSGHTDSGRFRLRRGSVDLIAVDQRLHAGGSSGG